MSIVLTSQICLSYGRRRGISDVNLRINAGEIFGFLGPNGAGKSTTIRILLGFLKAESGSATVLNRNCWSDSPAIKRDVGYVAGDVRLYPWLTVRRALQMASRIRAQDVTVEGMKLSERFQLETDLPVRKMSRGNRQKVALVLALAHRPSLVILDEPTTGLDPLMQDTLCDCLREMATEGRAVFFSSHTLGEVESLCDRVAFVRDGQIVADETIASLKSRAPRRITVTLENEISFSRITWPDFLENMEPQGQHVAGELTGSATAFVRWAASQKFADISIGVPSLDALFRGYYRPEPERAARCEDC